MIRPGPLSLDPGLCPGGVVVRVYAAPGEQLVVEQRLHPGSDVDGAALLAAALAERAPGWGSVLVAYDGDTGERFGPEAWVS